MASTVIHFSDSSDFGGAEVALLTLLEGLDRQRWNPVLFHHDSPGNRLLAETSRLNIRTRMIPRGQGARYLWDLVGVVRSERASVFHAHLPWALRCSSGLVAAALAGTPAVIATQQLYQGISSRRHILKQWLVGLGVDRYIAVSTEMKQRLSATLLFPRQKIEVIRNSVDLRRFPAESSDGSLRRALGLDPNRQMVLTLARLDPQKGLFELLGAAVDVPSATFVVAGEGLERERLENAARSLGVGDRVHFLGHREDVPQLLAACDLFVLPSRYEGLPLSVLEAMAAGKPVIATAIGGTREAVSDGETGLLVPPHDAAALAAAIRSVLSDPPLGARLGAAGREWVRREFSAERMVREVEQLYERVLSMRPAGRRGL